MLAAEIEQICPEVEVPDDIGRYIEIYLKDVVYNDNKLAKNFFTIVYSLLKINFYCGKNNFEKEIYF